MGFLELLVRILNFADSVRRLKDEWRRGGYVKRIFAELLMIFLGLLAIGGTYATFACFKHIADNNLGVFVWIFFGIIMGIITITLALYFLLYSLIGSFMPFIVASAKAREKRQDKQLKEEVTKQNAEKIESSEQTTEIVVQEGNTTKTHKETSIAFDICCGIFNILVFAGGLCGFLLVAIKVLS